MFLDEFKVSFSVIYYAVNFILVIFVCSYFWIFAAVFVFNCDIRLLPSALNETDKTNEI